MRNELRLRLGEPHQSGWTDDANGGTWTQGEIRGFFDQGQKAVCEDAIAPGNEDEPPPAILDDVFEINLKKGVWEYELPSDLIDVQQVMYRNTDGRYRRLKNANIRHFFDEFQPSSSSAEILRAYEIGESRGHIMTEGVATSGTNTTLVDADRSGSTTYAFDSGTLVLDDTDAALAVDDIVQNVTDGSEAVITAVTNSTTLTFSGGLLGGSRNAFEGGDYFKVVQAEANRRVLYVWPVPDAADVTSVVAFTGTTDVSTRIGNTAGTNQKVAQSFLFNRDTVLGAGSIVLGSSVSTPLGSIQVRVETDSSGPSATLVNPLAKASIESPAASATNYFEFAGRVRVAANTTVHLTAELPAQSLYYASPNNRYLTWVADDDNGYANGQTYTHDGSTWTAVTGQDQFFTLYKMNESERLLVRYARYPATIDANADQIEVPNYAKKAILWYAEHLAWLKVGNDRRADRAELRYKQEIAELRLRLQDQKQHPYRSVKNVMWNYTTGRRIWPRALQDSIDDGES